MNYSIDYLLFFGAGASAFSDSDPSSNLPPLGKHLFHELQEFSKNNCQFHYWESIPNNYVEIFNKNENFEIGMKKIKEDYFFNKKQYGYWYKGLDKINLYELLKEMAQFFFQFEPSNRNFYHKLAKTINRNIKNSRWKGAIASLNYDRLIDLSFRSNNMNAVLEGLDPYYVIKIKNMLSLTGELSDDIIFQHTEISKCIKIKGFPANFISFLKMKYDFLNPYDYISYFENSINKRELLCSIDNQINDNSILIEACYPHGICNLIMKEANFKNSHDIYLESISSNDYSLTDNIKSLSEFTPIMCHYEPYKFPQNGANLIKIQQERFRWLCKNVEKVIVIIGVNPNFADKHIWESVAKTKAKIVYINPSEDDIRKFENWAEDKGKIRNKDYELKQVSFAEVINDGFLYSLLGLK